jgi:hypothetical protein
VSILRGFLVFAILGVIYQKPEQLVVLVLFTVTQFGSFKGGEIEQNF